MRKYAKAFLSYFSDISCEPIVILFNLGYGIKYGAGVLDQLYLEKACRYELQGGWPNRILSLKNCLYCLTASLSFLEHLETDLLSS